MSTQNSAHSDPASHGHGKGDAIAGIDAARLDAGTAKKLFFAGVALAIVGIALAGAAALTDPKRFAYSYLTGFAFVVSLSLGGLVFVLIHHVTRSAWGVVARRHAEWLAGMLPLCAILFIPILFYSHDIYHAWMNPEPEDVAALSKKAGYLNTTFFYARAALYFLIWTVLSSYFRRGSLRQDVSGDPKISIRLAKVSSPSLFLFAFSLTFAFFDWVMSLAPHWYSTIFGVYIFAGASTSSYGLLCLITIALQKAGLFHRYSNVEHRHDLGKMLFGFTVFWAYIAFAQFFLIWYANIPEETIFYRDRWVEGWKAVSLLLLFGHFWIPFAWLLSRTAKRSYLLLGIIGAWYLFIHYVDMYWLIMPNFDPEGIHLTWIDAAGFLAPVGVLAAWMGYRISKDPLYPLKDPRLPETMLVDNI